MPLKFGHSGVLNDDFQLKFTKVANVARKNYIFWQAGIAEWVLGVYDDVPKRDKFWHLLIRGKTSENQSSLNT